MEFGTFDADANIRKMATEMEETSLLAKLEEGDLLPWKPKLRNLLIFIESKSRITKYNYIKKTRAYTVKHLL